MYKYGGTKRRRNHRRHGGVTITTKGEKPKEVGWNRKDGEGQMSTAEQDEHVSKLSKKKIEEELARLSASEEGKGLPFKEVLGIGTGTRTTSPSADQRVITERARRNSERKEGEVKKEGAARRHTRKHKKRARKTRHRR